MARSRTPGTAPPGRGILDPQGLQPNPLTEEPYSEAYRELAERWSSLPAWAAREEILGSIRDHPVTLVTSATGSGKTVIIPLLALHHTEYQGRVVVTMPKRRIIPPATEYATRILEAPPGTVGYRFRGSPKGSASESDRLVFETDGLLIAQLVQDPLLRDYQVVVIDEAHERKVQIDLLLLYLREIVQSGERPDFRVVIMSATIDTSRYLDYYQGTSVGVIEIPGGTVYPVETIWLPPGDKTTPLDRALRVLEEDPEVNVLLFTTSGGQARQMCRRVRAANPRVYCVEVYGEMPADLLLSATTPGAYLQAGYRQKLVIATNLAESSITIPDVSVVVDSGYELVSTWHPDLYGTALEKRKVTQAGALQRRGRVGRTGPGRCYHMYTEEDYLSRPRFPAPDISRDDPTLPLLQTSALTEKGTIHAGLDLMTRLMDPPSPDSLQAALRLVVIHRLTEGGGDSPLTPTAHLVTRLASIPLQRSLWLIRATELGVGREACDVVGLLEATGGRMTALLPVPQASSRAQLRGEQTLRRLAGKVGDHAALLHLSREYRRAEDRRTWAEEHGFRETILRSGRRTAMMLSRRLRPPQEEETQTGGKSAGVERRLWQALADSHAHLISYQGQPTMASSEIRVRLAEGCTLPPDALSDLIVYDNLSKMGSTWEYGIVSRLPPSAPRATRTSGG